MRLTRVKAVAKKEFIQVSRDPRSFGMAIMIPVLLLVLFGYALTLDVKNVPLAVWKQDHSQIATDFIRNFSSSAYFKIVGYYSNYTAMENEIDNRRAMMALVIPKDFSESIVDNKKVAVQLLVDGSDSNSATIALAYVNGVVARYNAALLTKFLSGTGISDPSLVDLRTRVWFNEDLKSRNFIIPGIIAIIIMIISALLTALTVAKEWERGTMEQLISTPATPAELIMGKFAPYFVIAFIDLFIAVAMGQFLFHVPFRGSLLLLLMMSGLFIVGALMLGMFISIATRNQLLASQISILATFLPTFLLSGFVYAISNMPKAVQLTTYLVPARYFIKILKGIYLKGVGIETLWEQVVFLSVFALVMIRLAGIKFKKKIA